MTTISIIMYEELIAFPDSMIKSPGGLLRKVKTEDNHSITSSIGSPLSTNSSIASETEMSPKTPRRYYRAISDFNVSFKSLFNSSLTSTAQDFIVKELNQLPHSFVASLHMKLILTDSPSFSEERYTMRSADFKTIQKAKERLYNIIFTAFLAKFPQVPTMWNKIMNKNNVTIGEVSEEMRELSEMIRQREIECSFFAVMMNKKYSKALNIVKFKELLVELDPASFTQEWFKDHNRELKQGYRVRFSEDFSH